jgi:hypothetical protein
LRIIEDAGEIDSETLRERYEQQADRPKSDSSRKRYLKLLREYELVERVGDGRGSRYRSLTSAHTETA